MYDSFRNVDPSAPFEEVKNLFSLVEIKTIQLHTLFCRTWAEIYAADVIGVGKIIQIFETIFVEDNFGSI